MPAGSATAARGTRRAAGRTGAGPASAPWTAPNAPEPVTRTSSARSSPRGPGESRMTGRVAGTTWAWRAGPRRRRSGEVGRLLERRPERPLERGRTGGLLRVGHPTRRQPLRAVAPSARVVPASFARPHQSPVPVTLRVAEPDFDGSGHPVRGGSTPP